MLLPSHWKFIHKIHGDMLPLPLRNGERLKSPCWQLMLDLNLSACRASRNVLGNEPLHASPPNISPQVPVHLRAPRVHCVPSLVSLLTNVKSELRSIWNY